MEKGQATHFSILGLPGVSVCKESICNTDNLGLIPGLERSLGEEKSCPFQWDLTEAEDIKKRWQEYTEELYKKDLHDPDNHDGVITHLEPDILECEVKRPQEVSLQTKLVEVIEFQFRYFKS